MNLNPNRAGGKPPPSGAAIIASVAVFVSIAIACIGVAGLIGWSTPLSIAGSIGLLAVIVVSEIRSATVLLDAERAWRVNRLKAAVAILTFAALEAVNVTAGHAGLAAIDADAAAARRAPYEANVTAAKAKATGKAAELEAFRMSVKASADRQTKTLEKAQEGCPTCLTAAANAAKNAGAQDKADALAMAPYLTAKAQADADLAAAEAKLGALPKGFPPEALWGFAGILVLLKGVSVWLAAGAPQRQGVTEIAPKTVAEMTEGELDAAASAAASMAAQVRHEKNRRLRRAA